MRVKLRSAFLLYMIKFKPLNGIASPDIQTYVHYGVEYCIAWNTLILLSAFAECLYSKADLLPLVGDSRSALRSDEARQRCSGDTNMMQLSLIDRWFSATAQRGVVGACLTISRSSALLTGKSWDPASERSYHST